jgi:cytochrome P450
MWRVVTRDVELGGEQLRQGDLVLLRYGSGNRDEAQFPGADRFDVERENARSHLAFGAGIHTCIGASLARKEMQTAFPILLSRLKNLRFQEGRNSFRYSPNILLRGVLELNIAFDPG